ncbi:hypothetical protein L208DRAFT_1381132 [Tricholoma matsutake]|nr:hypothetical protein L208DRAFT_1381132 [Tricholoma matsutake 945]
MDRYWLNIPALSEGASVQPTQSWWAHHALSSGGIAFNGQINELQKVNNDGAAEIWAMSAVIVDCHGKASEIGKTGWETAYSLSHTYANLRDILNILVLMQCDLGLGVGQEHCGTSYMSCIVQATAIALVNSGCQHAVMDRLMDLRVVNKICIVAAQHTKLLLMASTVSKFSQSGPLCPTHLQTKPGNLPATLQKPVHSILEIQAFLPCDNITVPSIGLPLLLIEHGGKLQLGNEFCNAWLEYKCHLFTIGQ